MVRLPDFTFDDIPVVTATAAGQTVVVMTQGNFQVLVERVLAIVTAVNDMMDVIEPLQDAVTDNNTTLSEGIAGLTTRVEALEAA